ncbi:OX-2 membrane glycoprotein-like [Hypomesus transpacificus]|uniref:OX-2 membrane glycoprotein-like n=1 Tax=Hypomesus transpacificus TaxID=137520 RepID=UPI001F08683E|nr:OX-2 membrane glycoprotein-like [Hypomesus transpacificus]
MKSVILFCLLSKALSFNVVANGDTTSVFGEASSFSCNLADSTGVLQVTWQRLFSDDSVETLATFSKRFGTQIIGPHQGRVLLTKASLNSTSIIVKNVTWNDEACYICSFNVYPSGSIRKQTCLTVQGISEVKTAKSQTPPHLKTGTEVVVSCSATGKPAPVITWITSANTEPSQGTVLNADQTATTTSNLTLRLSPQSGGFVDCLVNNGTKGQKHERILLPIIHEGQTENDKDDGRFHGGIALTIILCVPFLLLISYVIKRILKGQSVSFCVKGKGIV